MLFVKLPPWATRKKWLKLQCKKKTQKILRFWGLTGQRGWARLILDRLHDVALPPGDFKGSALDPDTVAHELHSFFFPDNGHGATKAAGFGWRNGGYERGAPRI
jgi:hypothetical protein